MDIRRIDDQISVSPQISPSDVTEIARMGFKLIVNNRPDDEEAGQPSGEAICDAAEALGMKYVAIPITQAGFSHPQIDAMNAAMSSSDGPVFAFCRSGTRSTNLWALASANKGEAPETLMKKAADAGYNIMGIRPMLDQLSGKA